MPATHSLLHRLRRSACVFACLLGASGAFAQAGALRFEPAPTALDCLTTSLPPGAKPAYPAQALLKDAVVRVRLSFSKADDAPTVAVTFNNGDEMFAQAVKDFVAAYRVPCLASGASAVEAVQEFQFLAKEASPVVFWNPPRPGSPQPDTALQECTQLTGAPVSPLYPESARRKNEAGTVLVDIKFKPGEAEPELDFVYSSGSVFTAAVRPVARDYRLACMATAKRPVRAKQLFKFRMQGDATSTIDAVSVTQLVSLAQDVRKDRVRFDFNSMGCPFAVQLGMYRPYADNDVGEVTRIDPNRREFIEWLRKITLKVSLADMKNLIGEVITVTVACTVLDLS